MSCEQAELSLLLVIEEEKKTIELYEEMLGLSWTKEEVERITSDKKEGVIKYPSKLVYPLSLMIKPDLIDILRSNFGLGPIDKDGKSTASLSQVSKEEFINTMGFKSFSLENGEFGSMPTVPTYAKNR